MLPDVFQFGRYAFDIAIRNFATTYADNAMSLKDVGTDSESTFKLGWLHSCGAIDPDRRADTFHTGWSAYGDCGAGACGP